MKYGLLEKAIAGGAEGAGQANMEAMRAEIMNERDARLNGYARGMQGSQQEFQAGQQQNLLQERSKENERHWNAFDERTKAMDQHYRQIYGKPSADMQLYNMFRNDQKLSPDEAWNRVESYKKAAATNPAEGARKIAHDLLMARNNSGLTPKSPGYQSDEQIIATANKYANQLYSSRQSKPGDSTPTPSMPMSNTSNADNPLYAGPASNFASTQATATPRAVGAPDYRSLYMTPDELGDEEE